MKRVLFAALVGSADARTLRGHSIPQPDPLLDAIRHDIHNVRDDVIHLSTAVQSEARHPVKGIKDQAKAVRPDSHAKHVDKKMKEKMLMKAKKAPAQATDLKVLHSKAAAEKKIKAEAEAKGKAEAEAAMAEAEKQYFKGLEEKALEEEAWKKAVQKEAKKKALAAEFRSKAAAENKLKDGGEGKAKAEAATAEVEKQYFKVLESEALEEAAAAREQEQAREKAAEEKVAADKKAAADAKAKADKEAADKVVREKVEKAKAQADKIAKDKRDKAVEAKAKAQTIKAAAEKKTLEAKAAEVEAAAAKKAIQEQAKVNAAEKKAADEKKAAADAKAKATVSDTINSVTVAAHSKRNVNIGKAEANATKEMVKALANAVNGKDFIIPRKDAEAAVEAVSHTIKSSTDAKQLEGKVAISKTDTNATKDMVKAVGGALRNVFDVVKGTKPEAIEDSKKDSKMPAAHADKKANTDAAKDVKVAAPEGFKGAVSDAVNASTDAMQNNKVSSFYAAKNVEVVADTAMAKSDAATAEAEQQYFKALQAKALEEGAVAAKKVPQANPIDDLGKAVTNVTKDMVPQSTEKKDTKVVEKKEVKKKALVDPMGNDACKCIGLVMEGTTSVTVGEKKVEYPAKTGSSCAAWDDKRYPGCEGDATPDWCKKQWCYVDPCTCTLEVPPKKSLTSAKWQGKPLYWSYATCGATDTYSAGNEKACVNQMYELGCKSLDGCAWDGKRCLGKELVDSCAANDKLDEAIYGHSSCRCIGMSPKEGTVNVKMGEDTYEFPASLGGHCDPWIDKLFPECESANPPFWCKQKWCYVDPCSCDLGNAKYNPMPTSTSVTYQGKPAYWSFATCGVAGILPEYLFTDTRPAFPPAHCPAKPPPTAAPEEVLKTMSEKKGLPAQGYNEVSSGPPVAHNDGKTATEDFGKEWPQTEESPRESYDRICKEYPTSKWCQIWLKSRKSPAKASSGWGIFR